MSTIHSVTMDWPVYEVELQGDVLRVSPREHLAPRNPFASFYPDGRAKSLHMSFSGLARSARGSSASKRSESVLSFTARHGILVSPPENVSTVLFPVSEVIREAERMLAFVALHEQVAKSGATDRRCKAYVERVRDTETASAKAGHPCWWRRASGAPLYGRTREPPAGSSRLFDRGSLLDQLQISILSFLHGITFRNGHLTFGAGMLDLMCEAVTKAAQPMATSGLLTGGGFAITGMGYRSLWWALWAMLAQEVQAGVKHSFCKYCHAPISARWGREACPPDKAGNPGCARRAAAREFARKRARDAITRRGCAKTSSDGKAQHKPRRLGERALPPSGRAPDEPPARGRRR